LFNWLFARHNQGAFVLRIEDTDLERGKEEWSRGIVTSLDWLGLHPDEGPYRQSERSEHYQRALDALWDAGALYACDCTRQDVEARAQKGKPPGYDSYCRDRGLPRGPGRALRFKTPQEGETVVEDAIRGHVVFPHKALEDFVVARSDGKPVFVLANAVDDRDMAITHVIRGEDLLPTTPKGILLWQALDRALGEPLPLPAFAHLPMLVNEKRQKLSKRRDPVALEDYERQGYLPEAMRNYLALLGWSPPGEDEMVPDEVLISAFDLSEVNHSPAFFDTVKLRHLNGRYVRAMPLQALAQACQPWIEAAPWSKSAFDQDVFMALLPLAQERMATLAEIVDLVGFAFVEELPIDQRSWEKAIERDPSASVILDMAIEAYQNCEWNPDALHQATSALAEQLGKPLGKAQAPIRVAVMGSTVGLPLFDSLHVLGRERALARLRAARARIPA